MENIEDYIIELFSSDDLHVSINYHCIVIIDDINDLHAFIHYDSNFIILNKDFDSPYEEEYDYMKIFTYLNDKYKIHYHNRDFIFEIFREKSIVYNRDIIIDNIL